MVQRLGNLIPWPIMRYAVDHRQSPHFYEFDSTGFLKDCFGGFDHHRQLHLVLDSLEEIADIEMNGGKREDEEEEEPFR